jgi:sirohydrochlorin ferrochelatase
LVIAPDRGFLGNREIEDTVQQLSKQYLSSLVFISLAEEFDTPTEAAFKAAVAHLKRGGAKRIIIIPLVITGDDPHLKKSIRFLSLEKGHSPLAADLKWAIAPPMSEDFRIAQILEDRAKTLSEDPANERLIVLGYGATNPEEETTLQSGLKNLISEVHAHLPFKEIEVVVMYHTQTDETVRKETEEKLRKKLQEIGSKKDLKNILVSFDLGFKHTGLMQLNGTIGSMIEGLPVAFEGGGVFPHPSALHWITATANRFSPVSPDQMGVVIMAHGAGHYINQTINDAVSPLKKKIALETAFGMAEPDELEAAIAKLESRGMRRILILRLFDSSSTFKDSTEYIIGARKDPPAHLHGGLPRRVRTGSILSSSGGLDADPLISEVLRKRIMEISKAPEKETVLLLAHGAGSDRQNDLWLEKLRIRAEYIREKSSKPFKAIQVATIREDWPEKREKALQEIREMIQKGNKDGGRVLVISARIAGAGPYQKYLKGEDYVFNGTGVAPDPNLTQWMSREINVWREQFLKDQGQ